MASDEIYDACLVILRDASVDEDDKTDKLEELIKNDTTLTGKALENAVLDVLWRYRNNSASSAASPLLRHTVARRQSPARWPSRSGTPATAAAASSPLSRRASPAPPPGLGPRPPLLRMRSSQASPFTSPKPSPRMPFATTYNPRSPSFETRPPTARASSIDPQSDLGSDDGNLPGLDSASSFSSSSGVYSATADASMTSWNQSSMNDMTPYDILRAIFRDEKTDDEIEGILEANSYDLGAAIASVMGPEAGQLPAAMSDQDKTFLVGKSLRPPSRPATPPGQAKSSVPCRYWLSTGQCLRADCRFSHDLRNHVCKYILPPHPRNVRDVSTCAYWISLLTIIRRYWLAGGCLAGESCMFSHDPSSLMSGVSLNDSTYAVTPPLDGSQASFEVQDYAAFPALHGATSESSLKNLYASREGVTPPPGLSSRSGLAPEFIPGKEFIPASHQLPKSTTSLTQQVSADNVDDFPTLGAAALRQSKRHHGKRGHSNREREQTPSSSLADLVRMSPAPNPQGSPRQRPARGRQAAKDANGAATSIPAPERIPWLETGDAANKAYMEARKEAIRHGGARNKFLQSAAQAWNRNDVRAAKALSLRGQSENELMREAHREAAKHLFEQRNTSAAAGSETYVDLHGLHPAEAVTYLNHAVETQKITSALQRSEGFRFLYAIVGTGHHSKGGRDKVGKAIRGFLNDWNFAYREFSVPGDRGGSGGILGIDVESGGVPSRESGQAGDDTPNTPNVQQGKVRILKAEDAHPSGTL